MFLNVADLLAGLPCAWCFCGGWAIDLFVGRMTRPHKDVDVAIFRRDQLALQSHLRTRGWRLEVATCNGSVSWPEGVLLDLPFHEVRCQNDGFDPPLVEVLFNEAVGTRFKFRRNQAITLPLDRTIGQSADGFPFLSPEVVLLYKCGDEDSADFQVALPKLGSHSRAWFKQSLIALRPDHPWLARL